MNVSEFEKKGIRLSLTKEKTLKYSAPKFLKGKFLEQLRQNKSALIRELSEKVTDVTDSQKIVTDVSGLNHYNSDGCDGCDGSKKFPIEKIHTCSEAIYVSPIEKEENTHHTCHTHHSTNENNNLTRHAIHHDPPQPVIADRAKEIDPEDRKIQKSVNAMSGANSEIDSANSGSFHEQLYRVIQEFNDKGIALMDLPPSIRRKIRGLETEIDFAALEGDDARFSAALDQWRNLILDTAEEIKGSKNPSLCRRDQMHG
jgi:hypothetical protein